MGAREGLPLVILQKSLPFSFAGSFVLWYTSPAAMCRRDAIEGITYKLMYIYYRP